MSQIEPSTGEAVLDGIPFYYERVGKGHPLVLVHAGIADLSMWNEQVAPLAQHYDVLRYDLRGYGKTPLPAGSFSHANDLYNMLKLLGIESAYLIGCSMGGTTIIDFALEHPEMVDAQILVACAPSGFEFLDDEAMDADGEAMRLQQEHESAIQQGDIAKAAEIETAFWVVGLQRTVEQVDPTLLARVNEMNKIALANKITNPDGEQLLEPPAITRLGEINIPTLVIVGDIDDPNIVRSCELLATQIPNAQRAIIDGTAHFPNMERPAEFNQLVLEFLAHV